MDEITLGVFKSFRDELFSKQRFKQDWDRYCTHGSVSGGKGQPIFPPTTIGSFTTLLGVAYLRALNHPKSIAKQAKYFTFVSLKGRR